MSTSKMECEDENSNSSSNAAEEGDNLLNSAPSSPYTVQADKLGSVFPSPELQVCKSDEIEESPSFKRKIGKELFPLQANKLLKSKEIAIGKQVSGSLVSYAPQSSLSLPLLAISQITNSKLRFAFEGKILNTYGTYKSTQDYQKYLKADLADREACSTITLVISEGFIQKFVDKIEESACIRIEGANVLPRKNHDGGSCAFSLHVDATTHIIKAETFDVCLMFMPETKICDYFHKVQSDPSLKATIAFVVIQVDKVKKSKGVGTFEQLTIADGPSSMDLATLTFVNKQKKIYHELVHQYQKGSVVMYVARNIGVWKDQPNTLSILDITLLTPIFSPKCKRDLEAAFRFQIAEMGYGKEVYGSLEITNFNAVLIIKKCVICKQTKVNKISEGGYCFECGKAVDLFEVPSLEGRISTTCGQVVDVTLVGDGVDKVLGLEDTLVNLYQANAILTRVLLSEIIKVGSFLIDNQGCVIGFNAGAIAP